MPSKTREILSPTVVLAPNPEVWMFDSNAQGLADDLYNDALRNREIHLRDRLREVVDEATSKGALGNGRFHLHLGEVYAQEFQARSNLLWDILQQVLSAHGVVPSEALANTIKQFLANRLSRENQDLTERLRKDTNRFKATPSLPGAVSDQLRPIERGVFARVDLLVKRLEVAPAKTAVGTVQNFYGSNVGVVQTGSGAMAVSHQTITTGDAQATEAALGALAKALSNVTEAGGYSQRELLAVIAELTEEIRRPQPNRLKVGQLASGLAMAVQTAGAAKPAYELLRTAFLSWGMNLPQLP